MTNSWEIGADLRFFNSRTRLDVAYYSTSVDNQIVSVRVSPASGTILQTRNEGTIENHGVELSLQQDIIRTHDIDWNVNFNISGDLHIHLGDDALEYLLSDDLVDDETEDETEDFEGDEINPSGLLVFVEGLPADVDREAVESIIAAAVELLNAEVRETLANRKDEAHERI